MSSFELHYQLTGTGWAEVSFGENALETIDVSYLHDTLLDLSTMAIKLKNGEKEAHALFMDEPGEHILVVKRNGDAAKYELRWYKDWFSWGLVPVKEYEVVLAGETTVSIIVAEIVKVLGQLYFKYGEKGYQDKWAEHDFPTEHYRMLANA